MVVLEACILHLACIGSTAKSLENAQQEPVPLSQIPHQEWFSKRSFLLRRWAWCLPCGFDHIVPYFYVIYFGALLGEHLHNLKKSLEGVPLPASSLHAHYGKLFRFRQSS